MDSDTCTSVFAIADTYFSIISFSVGYKLPNFSHVSTIWSFPFYNQERHHPSIRFCRSGGGGLASGLLRIKCYFHQFKVT